MKKATVGGVVSEGMLCDAPEEATAAILMLARNKNTRIRMAEEARDSLATLADPSIIGERWQNLFAEISASPKPPPEVS